MTRTLAAISLLAFSAGSAAGQQQDSPKPAFDAADVHVSPRRDWVKSVKHALQGGYLAADRYELRRATMLDLIRLAYNVDADAIDGGPSWIDYDRFEIAGKTKPGTGPEALRLMLQTLLADRFHLVVKNDTRQAPAYMLSKGKRELKLKAAADTSSTTGCVQHISLDNNVPHTDIQCRNVTMEAFARTLRRAVWGPSGNLPVVDSTGIEGGWDIDLQVGPRNGATEGPPADLMETLDKLGLKIEMGKIPQPVLAVVSVQEQPEPNPAGVAEALPPLPPPQFEVAAVKVPCNGNASIAPKFESGGRVTATCMPPMSLIREAWNLAPFEEVVGAPKWLTEPGTAHNVSIVAKAPPGVAPDPQNSQMARDIVKIMLRSLLMERYRMAVHYEDRPMNAHTLVAVKPKLTKADPASRTGCTRQNLPPQGRASVTRLVCHNMTMAQFAEQIQAYDSDIFYPVADGTGLEGAWDFTIQYDPLANLRERFQQVAAAADASNGEASDPTASLSFTAAIEKQLGLKVEVHKRPEPVLVIDRMAETPTEN